MYNIKLYLLCSCKKKDQDLEFIEAIEVAPLFWSALKNHRVRMIIMVCTAKSCFHFYLGVTSPSCRGKKLQYTFSPLWKFDWLTLTSIHIIRYRELFWNFLLTHVWSKGLSNYLCGTWCHKLIYLKNDCKYSSAEKFAILATLGS